MKRRCVVPLLEKQCFVKRHIWHVLHENGNEHMERSLRGGL